MSESYEGEVMHQCMIRPFDFEHTHAVVVSGDKWNPCGHAILNAGGFAGWYFHVAGRYIVPRYMRPNDYKRYLTENGKHEIRRTVVKIPNPIGAHRKLEELLSTPWFWGGLPHNCASFLEAVVQAGGSKAGLYFNCPTLEAFR